MSVSETENTDFWYHLYFI